MKKSFWLVSACAFAIATPALAQDNSTPTNEGSAVQAGDVQTDDSAENEIIVTAQGRQQALQDVPVAVSAVTAESLQNSGASDIRQLNQLAPSLLVSSTGSEANGSARIRGIGTVGDNPGLESSVAVFIDGVYRSRSGIGLNELGEIERIEVLRGPQGTLFGRNASAGLINIVSKKPNLTESEGYAEATYGNYDNIRVGGGLTGPIGTSGLAYRLDGIYVSRDGFYKNATNVKNDGTEPRINDRNRYFVRGQLLYEPSDALEIRLIGDYSHRNESCCGAVYVETRETFDPTPGTPGDFEYASGDNRIVDILQSLGGELPSAGHPFNRQVALTPGRTYRNKTDDYGISGQADWDLGAAKLTSITAYREYKAGGAADLDYGNVDLYYRDDDGNSYRQFKTFSQELRLQGSAFAGHLDWLIGAYYAHEKLKVVDNVRFGTQYGAFAACRVVAGTDLAATPAILRDPTKPGCLGTTPLAALGGATGRQAFFAATAAKVGGGPAGAAIAGDILGAIDRLSTVNDLGDVDSVYNQTSNNFAFFTHNIIKITDQLSLTLGARYTNETKKFNADFNNNNTVCPAQQAALGPYLSTALAGTAAAIITLTCTGNSSSLLNSLDLHDKRKEDEWTGTAILSYKPTDDILLYGSYSKGYKAGGYNLDRSDLGVAYLPRSNADAANLEFAAEKVDAYELGAKISGRHFTINVAAFHEAFQDFQLNTFNGTVFIVQNINSCSEDLGGADSDPSAATGSCAGKNLKPGVISKGVELEAAVYPVRDLALTAGYTYADTKYQHDLVGHNLLNNGQPAGEPLDPFLFNLPGKQISNAPKHVVTGSLTYTPDIGASGLSGLFYVDTRYSSHYNTGSDLFPEKEQSGFWLVNARVGVRGPDGKWSVELWGQNIFNQDYQQVAFNTPFQGSNSRAQVQQFGSPGFATGTQVFSSYLAEPRTYGVTLRTRF